MKVLITGTPRSGTTMLRNLINTDSRCYIYDELRAYWLNKRSFKERYKNKFGGITEYSGIEFISKLENHIDLAGDKSPISDEDPKKYSKILNDNNIKVIFCIRNPLDIIASSMRNYKLGFRDWWCKKDFESAYDWWIESHKTLKNLYNFTDNKIVIDYYYCLQYKYDMKENLSNFLNIDLNINMDKYIGGNINNWKTEFKDIPKSKVREIREWSLN